MDYFEITTAILSSLVLFLFAIESFGQEIQFKFKDQLKPYIERAAARPFFALLSGSILTAIVQSSSAISLICVSLVNAGVMTLESSIPILMGSNIGSTFTAQLVAFKLTHLAPYLLVIGYGLHFYPGRLRVLSKSIFYFGLLFFGLQLLGQQVSILKDYPVFSEVLSHYSSPYMGVFFGLVLTVLFQSSSVTSGLVIILASGHVINMGLAVGLLIGSNVGTTTTAMIASIKLTREAKQSALVNLFINVFGSLIFLPFLNPFVSFVDYLGSDISQRLANTHLFFNLVTISILFPLRKYLALFVKRVLKSDDKSEFVEVSP